MGLQKIQWDQVNTLEKLGMNKLLTDRKDTYIELRHTNYFQNADGKWYALKTINQTYKNIVWRP